MGWHGLDSSGSGQGPVKSSCEPGNELSGSITFWKFFGYLCDWRFLKKDSDSWSYLLNIEEPENGRRLFLSVLNLFVLIEETATYSRP
jgi:hypothetical protein